MPLGMNSTFRQVGIATGIALLGTLFSNNVKDALAGWPPCPVSPQRPADRHGSRVP